VAPAATVFIEKILRKLSLALAGGDHPVQLGIWWRSRAHAQAQNQCCRTATTE
jgi:hypothetical protein